MSDADLFSTVEVIRPNLTRRAVDSAGNRVILKRLDPECLQHGRLHPNVKERLARIRELPLRDLAVLHGVDVFDGEAVLVWDDLPGETLEQFVRHSTSPTLARDVALLIDALHGHGIVHGAIHARNIIVDNTGRPRLTHLSPLLHYDPDVDRDDLATLLNALGLDAAAPATAEPAERPAWRNMLSRGSFWLAMVIALVAIAVGLWIYRAERGKTFSGGPAGAIESSSFSTRPLDR